MPMVATAHLFRPLHRELMTLLRSLDATQWHAPTVAGQWRVRDVAAHLLQGDLQRLSADRDGYIVPLSKPLNTYDDVLSLINTSNRDAVAAMPRFSHVARHGAPKTVLESCNFHEILTKDAA